MTTAQWTAVEQHLIARLAAAPLVTHPFAYTYVTEFFPADFYQLLLANLPKPSAMMSATERFATSAAYKDRRVMRMIDGQVDAVRGTDQTFWRDLFGLLARDSLTDAMLRKFSITRDMIRLPPDCHIATKVMLTCDGKGYRLKPHTDAPDKIISAVFYLPRDDKYRAHGTVVYRPKDRTLIAKDSRIFEPEDFDVITVPPYVPNSAIVFRRTDNSFHGVELLEDPAMKRYTMQYNVYADRAEPE